MHMDSGAEIFCMWLHGSTEAKIQNCIQGCRETWAAYFPYFLLIKRINVCIICSLFFICNHACLSQSQNSTASCIINSTRKLLQYNLLTAQLMFFVVVHLWHNIAISSPKVLSHLWKSNFPSTEEEQNYLCSIGSAFSGRWNCSHLL